jgi:hypothetical protein
MKRMKDAWRMWLLLLLLLIVLRWRIKMSWLMCEGRWHIRRRWLLHVSLAHEPMDLATFLYHLHLGNKIAIYNLILKFRKKKKLRIHMGELDKELLVPLAQADLVEQGLLVELVEHANLMRILVLLNIALFEN